MSEGTGGRLAETIRRTRGDRFARPRGRFSLLVAAGELELVECRSCGQRVRYDLVVLTADDAPSCVTCATRDLVATCSWSR